MFDHDNLVFTPFARGIIRRKIQALIGHAGFTNDGREDLEQELLLRLLRGLSRFDPKRRHPNVFITTVVERSVAMLIRERRAMKRFSGAVYSLDSANQDGRLPELVDPLPNEEHASAIASDVADVLARLPEKLRSLAERLKSQSLSEVARDLGIPRTTLQRKVERIRKQFEDANLQEYL